MKPNSVRILATRVWARCVCSRGGMFSAPLSTSRNTHVLAPAEPPLNDLAPRSDLIAEPLFGGGERFQLRRLQPPFRACPIPRNGLGPELIAVAFECVTVDHAVASDRPEPARAGRVPEIAASRWIDGGGEHALPRQIDRVLAVRRTETVMTDGSSTPCWSMMQPW